MSEFKNDFKTQKYFLIEQLRSLRSSVSPVTYVQNICCILNILSYQRNAVLSQITILNITNIRLSSSNLLTRCVQP
jgi:hypothetical protein